MYSFPVDIYCSVWLPYNSKLSNTNNSSGSTCIKEVCVLTLSTVEPNDIRAKQNIKTAVIKLLEIQSTSSNTNDSRRCDNEINETLIK